MSEHDPSEPPPEQTARRRSNPDPTPAAPPPELDEVDEEGWDSFPASDPPAHTGTT